MLEQTKANLAAQLEQQAQGLGLPGEYKPPPPIPAPAPAPAEDDAVTRPEQLQMTPDTSSRVDVDSAAVLEAADGTSSTHEAQSDQPAAPPSSARGGVMGYFFGRRRKPARQP